VIQHIPGPPAVPHRELRGERGVALVVALLAMLVMVALGAGLMVTAATESRITRNFRNHTEAFYAADAVLERTVDDLGAIADWNLVLSGGTRSAFVDGEPRGARVLADGRAVDLDGILNDANCRKPGGCSSAAMDAITADRPWGANNPRWQLFAWGYLNDLTPTATISSPFYVVVLVADDPSECDDNPLVDGGAMVSCPAGARTNPGAGILNLRAEAFGPFGAHRAIELTAGRPIPYVGPPDVMSAEGAAENYTTGYGNGLGRAGVRILSWREVR
jgi:PilX N-terminal